MEPDYNAVVTLEAIRHVTNTYCTHTDDAISPRHSSSRRQQSSVETAFNQFWHAKNPDRRRADPSTPLSPPAIKFDDAFALTEERTFACAADVPTGVVRLSRETADAEFAHSRFDVPPAYDPARKYQVRSHSCTAASGARMPRPAATASTGSLGGRRSKSTCCRFRGPTRRGEGRSAEPARDSRCRQAHPTTWTKTGSSCRVLRRRHGHLLHRHA